MTLRQAFAVSREWEKAYPIGVQWATPTVIGGNSQTGYDYGVRIVWMVDGSKKITTHSPKG